MAGMGMPSCSSSVSVSHGWRPRLVLSAFAETALAWGARPARAGAKIGSREMKLSLIIAIVLAFLANAADGSVIYNFTNFGGPGSGSAAGAGTNMNGIANNGAAVGFGIDNAGTFTNFVRNPSGTFTTLNSVNAVPGSMAFGINSAGDVVGAQNGAAFFLPPGGPVQTLASATPPSAAFGINDNGNIVGQFTSGAATPGFYIANNAGQNFVTVNAPSGPNTVNAQGVNNNGLIMGFYVGTDGQDHGFMAPVGTAVGGMLTGTPITDPIIPPVSGEPGATFVFSQILGINDNGLAVGYYGDSTTSQHGFFYDTHTGQYTFLDDPFEGFSNGVEITQITGITDSGEITGFYSDANGVFHGFVASPLPEPAT